MLYLYSQTSAVLKAIGSPNGLIGTWEMSSSQVTDSGAGYFKSYITFDGVNLTQNMWQSDTPTFSTTPNTIVIPTQIVSNDTFQMQDGGTNRSYKYLVGSGYFILFFGTDTNGFIKQ